MTLQERAHSPYNIRWPVALAVTLIVALIATALILQLRRPEPVPALDEGQHIAQCIDHTLEQIKPDKIDVALLRNVSNLCLDQINQAYVMGDFNVRRSSYGQQQFEGRVMLWMVVAITISGVLLAGLQLVAAYNLASIGRMEFEQGGAVTLQKDKVSMKSSVTGLLILTVSLAFFVVYVKWVYKIADDAATTPPTTTQGSVTSGLGSAPN